jgi:hypothetical protein
MRFHSSRAQFVVGAVAILLAATSPAWAVQTVIDSFTNPTAPSVLPLSGTGSIFYDPVSEIVPDGVVFNSRQTFGYADSLGGVGTPANQGMIWTSATGSGGSLILNQSKDFVDTPLDQQIITSGLLYQFIPQTPFNGIGYDFTQAGLYDSLRISRSGVSVSGTLGAEGGLRISVTGTGLFPDQNTVVIPQATWFANGSLDIPLTLLSGTFSGLINNVAFLEIAQQYTTSSSAGDSLADRQAAYASSVTLTEIALVPEPTQMVFVAGVGAALGLWRMRKLRANGGAIDDATAC